jgi:hypothetical protein
MNIYYYSIQIIGALAALQFLVLIANRVTRRLILPAKVCAFLSLAGFASYICFLFVRGSHSIFGPIVGLRGVWIAWTDNARILLPLLSGLLGWVALRSRWRWGFLWVGIGVFLMPYIIVLTILWLGRCPARLG